MCRSVSPLVSAKPETASTISSGLHPSGHIHNAYILDRNKGRGRVDGADCRAHVTRMWRLQHLYLIIVSEQVVDRTLWCVALGH